MTRFKLSLTRSTLTLLAAGLVLAFAPPASGTEPTAPGFSKAFMPATIGPGSTSMLIFTINNSDNPIYPVEILAFDDEFPFGMQLAAVPFVSNSCDGTVTFDEGDNDPDFDVRLVDGRVGAGASCEIVVNVTAEIDCGGVRAPVGCENISGDLTSDAGNSGPASASLFVDTELPGFSKSFVPGSVPLGNKSTLTFTIDNSANMSRVGNLDFTDNLPAGMVVADPANASTDCVSESLPNTAITAVPGTDVIILDANGSTILPSSAVLQIGATCTVTVEVVSTGTGMLDNVSDDLLADFVAAGKASATLEVTRTDLALRKSFTDDPVPPGGTVTLEFVIDNFDRDFSATGVAFTDDLTTALAGLTFSSLLSNDCGGSVTGVGTNTITLMSAIVAPQGFCTLRVSLSVPAGATPGSYTNTTGTVTGTVDGVMVIGNTASDDLFVEPVPILTKTFIGDPVDPGDTIDLEFTVTNTSTTSSATDIAFEDLFDVVLATASVTPGDGCCGAGSICTFTPLSDPAPPGATVPATLSISGGTLEPAGMAGDSCTFSITLDVGSDTPPGVYPNTTSEITATVDGATRTGEPASDNFTVIAAPTLTKNFADDPVPPGGTATLEFTLSYPPDASANATGITFTDDLAPVLAGLTANLPPSPDPPCGAGSTLTGSAGDTLLTLMGGTLMPGETCTFSVTVDVPAGAAAGSYANTTSGVGATAEGLPVTSAPASDDLKVAGLVFTKEFLGDPVIPGDTVTLRFTIDNVHPTLDATITSFSDDLNAALSGLAATGPPSVNDCSGILSGTTSLSYAGGSVSSGTSCAIEVEVLVPAAAADGTYVNTTSGLSATQGGTVTIDPATDLLIVNSNLLQLTKEFTDDPVPPGDPVTLEFTLTNLDAANAASGIGFSDNLGAALTDLTFDSVLFDDCLGTVGGTGTDMITVTGVSLAAGGSCTLRVTLTVPGMAAAGIYTNTTSDVTGDIGGFAVSGDAVSDDLEVAQLLLFSKSFDGPTTATGTATLTFTITNPGTDSANDIDFTDDLDAVISGLIATSLPAVPCGAGSSITGISFLTLTGAELPPMGGMCSFAVDVLVPASATAGTFPNTTSDLRQNGLPVADPATADLTIEPPPTFAKVFLPDSIFAGDTTTLTFTIDNNASALAASSLAFTDNLPAGVTVATPSVTVNGCGGTLTATAGASVISLTGGSVAAGSTCTIDVDVTSSVPGMHVNTTLDLTSSSGNSGTASDTLTVAAVPEADLELTKIGLFEPATAGSHQIYELVATNLGPSTATDVELVDVLPAEATFVIAEPLADCSEAGGVVTCDLGDLAAGESRTVVIRSRLAPDAPSPISNLASVSTTAPDSDPGNDAVLEDNDVLPPFGLAMLDDVDTSGFPEAAVALPGSIRVLVKDVESGAVLHDQTLLTPAHSLVAFEKTDDVNGNGSEDLVLLAGMGSESALEVLDGLTGASISSASLPSGFVPLAMTVTADDGFGTPVVLAVARRETDGLTRVFKRSAVDGSDLGYVPQATALFPVDLATVPSFTADAGVELAMLAVNSTTGGRRVVVKELSSGLFLRIHNLPTARSPVGLETVPECCGFTLAAELAVYEYTPATDGVRARTIDADDGSLISDRLFGGGAQPSFLRVVPDFGDAPAAELAGLLLNAAQAAYRVRDVATGTSLGARGVAAGSVPLGLAVAPDTYDSTADELAVLWTDPISGAVTVSIFDAATGSLVKIVPIP